jgi:hypothetical protein
VISSCGGVPFLRGQTEGARPLSPPSRPSGALRGRYAHPEPIPSRGLAFPHPSAPIGRSRFSIRRAISDSTASVCAESRPGERLRVRARDAVGDAANCELNGWRRRGGVLVRRVPRLAGRLRGPRRWPVLPGVRHAAVRLGECSRQGAARSPGQSTTSHRGREGEAARRRRGAPRSRAAAAASRRRLVVVVVDTRAAARGSAGWFCVCVRACVWMGRVGVSGAGCPPASASPARAGATSHSA